MSHIDAVMSDVVGEKYLANIDFFGGNWQLQRSQETQHI